MRVLIILPTYNERENLARLCNEISKAAPQVHILIIDDNSPDGTGELADELACQHAGRVFVIHRAAKLGLGTAIMAGFKYAMDMGYDFVVNMDSDLSHDPQELPQMLSAAQDADLVIASRHVGDGKIVGWNWWRRFIHWAAQQYTSAFFGWHVSDYTNSFKAYRVDALKTLPLSRLVTAGFVWHTLLIYMFYKAGFKIREVPSVFVVRRAGKSKMSLKEMLTGLAAILRMRFNQRLC